MDTSAASREISENAALRESKSTSRLSARFFICYRQVGTGLGGRENVVLRTAAMVSLAAMSS